MKRPALVNPALPPAHQNLPALDHVPGPSADRIAMRVTPEAERVLRRGHPWLFDQSITHQSREGQPGDLAVIFDHKRRFLAVGLYDPHAPIRVRILQHHTPAPIDQDWFRSKLADALRLREPFLQLPGNLVTTGYRLVHGENDQLPGLVVDHYAGTEVIKLYTLAWLPHLNSILAGLTELMPMDRLVLRLSRTLVKQPHGLYGLEDGMLLYGPKLVRPVIFQENGLYFEADVVHGQKTGFFLDQRDNRRRVGSLASGKSVLNVFAYTGGFSVYAAQAGAPEITSIDTSLPALEAAQRNLEHNHQLPVVASARHKIIVEDAFLALARLQGEGRRFELVIIDPPAFAQKQSQVDQALRAYERLTRLGLGVLQPGGRLVQASCSSRVEAEIFFETVVRTARAFGRPLHEIERTGHPLDHPVSFPEGAYLKCLFATAP